MASGQTYSAREIAEALGVAKRTVNLRAAREKWPRSMVRSNGGDNGVYPAEALPDDVRAKLTPAPGAAPAPSVSGSAPANVSAYEAAPEYNRARADQRLAVLKAWETWRCDHPEQPLMEARPAFLAAWSERHPDERLPSVASLRRWEAAYAERGLDGLVPDFGTSAGRTTIPDEAQNAFLSFYLGQGQLSIARCRDMAVGALRGKGLAVEVPSADAFGRWVRSLDQGSLIYAREGECAWGNKVAPFLQRTFAHQASNDTWVGDHKRFDVFCRGAKPGELIRPWLSAWADQRSRLLAGWHIHTNPCGDTILLSFRHGALERGIPREWYIDNGADYRSFAISGAGGKRGRRVHLSEKAAARRYLSLADQVGIEKVTFAIPGTPQAKIIERLFRTVKDHFDRLWGSFTGGTTVEKPEQLEAECKKHWAKLPTLDEFRATFEAWVRDDYNRRPHDSLDGDCPEAAWAANLQVKRTASAERLRLMMLSTMKPHKLRRNGIELHGVWYDSPPDQAVQLADLFGREVYVRYDPADMSRIAVYDLDDRYLCEATNREIARHGLDQELVKNAAKEKARRLRRVKEGLQAQAELARQPDMLAAYMAGQKADAEANPIAPPQVPTELVQPTRPARPADPDAPSAPVVSLTERRAQQAEIPNDDDEVTALSPAAWRRLMAQSYEEAVDVTP